jgi:hypothetical protein
MSDEWGPWIEHDGKSRPDNGVVAFVVRANGVAHEIIVGRSKFKFKTSFSYKNSTPSWWLWEEATPQFGEVVRYRIRKPRALIELRDMIADLPAPTERVDA